ncbi:MAG: transcriptional regulator [Lawsonibacter sp.]|nr:transcriptional regulator [Lawsonibacter sp.]
MAWCLAGLLLCAALLLLRRSVVRLLRLVLRSSVGLAALALFSQVGGLLGIKLGVNLVNALVLGLLGVPGFGLLLMIQWVLR